MKLGPQPPKLGNGTRENIPFVPQGCRCENAHININNQDWWAKKIINIKKKFVDTKIICVCALKENGKRILFPLQFDDKITNYSK